MTIQRNFKTFDLDRTSAPLLPPNRSASDVIALSPSAACLYAAYLWLMVMRWRCLHAD